MKFTVAKNKRNSEVRRVGRFGIVGILNTLIDFVLFNIFSSSRVGYTLIQANLISTTCAMIFSYVANRSFVFRTKGRATWKQAVIFFAVTAFGLYVLQNETINLLTKWWVSPLHLAASIVHLIGLSKIFSDGFVIKNGAKAVATLVSLTWNYFTYKKWVFKE